MDTYEKKYKELEGKIKKAYLYAQTDSTKAVLEEILPELAESEDEIIRKWLIGYFNQYIIDGMPQVFGNGLNVKDVISWLEKQGASYTKEEVDDAYLKGINDAKNEIEKQHEANYQIRKDIATFIFNYRGDIKDRAKWMDYLGIKISFVEKQESVNKNKVVKGLIPDVATSLINYINANTKGMCLSNIECEDIEDAIIDRKWYKIYNYMKKKLEKQVEKPQGKTAFEVVNEEKVDNANKVEPKFHEGEWIVWQDKCCKVNYNGCGYELVDQNGLSTSLEYGTADENAHLWDTTKDAKDGDVLVSDNIVFIFNKIHDIWIKCHCSLYEDNSFYGVNFDLMHIKYGKEVFPATKEQCDKLFKAMADAGYTFDFEKKELKKIEKPTAWSQED